MTMVIIKMLRHYANQQLSASPPVFFFSPGNLPGDRSVQLKKEVAGKKKYSPSLK
jgi:hypothetical protein